MFILSLFSFFKIQYPVRDSAWSGPWVAVCLCWPAQLWFLHERAFKAGRVSGFGLFCSHFIFLGVFLCTAQYRFTFVSCMNSCGWVREVASRDTFWGSGDIYVAEPKILINAHGGELGKNELIINYIYNTLKTYLSVYTERTYLCTTL